MFKYFIISIFIIISPLISDDSVKDEGKNNSKQEDVIKETKKTEEPAEPVIEEIEKLVKVAEIDIFESTESSLINNKVAVAYNTLDGPIPSYTITSNPERMKISFRLNNKEYNNYYHEDGTSLGIDYLDCGQDGLCDGDEGYDTADVGENDEIDGKDIYTSNGIMIDAMYHGNYGVGFDFHFLKETRTYTFLSDIVDKNLIDHPYYSVAQDFETKQDLTHYDFGVYYVWNEISDKKDNPLLNTENYTFPTTRILTGLYFKGSDNQTLNSNANSIYMLGAMDFIIHDRIILSNQLIVDYSDKDNISPCSVRSKLIWNINSEMALAPSFTYKKYDSIEIADSDIYEGFIMVEGAYQFLNHNFGNLDYNIKLMPYFMMSILGSENLVHAKNEFGLNLKVFFN